MLIYLGLSAVAVIVAALLLLLFTDPSPPAVAHLVFAVGIMPLIFAAITHFIPVLTRSGRAQRILLLAPLLLQLAGGVTFLAFSGETTAGALPQAATGTLLIALAFAGWLVLRARRTLGRPHPGWRWYLVAIVFLSLALMLVPAMSWWPEWRPEMRLLHLHLNALGFIGLSALGTLQVLLPTTLGEPDADAAARLRCDLLPVVVAVLAMAIGAAFALPLAMAGGVLCLAVALDTGASWLRRYRWQRLIGDGTAALVAALSGFLLLLLFGMAHGLRIIDGRDSVPAFVVAFLLPLVTGALSQLLPVWCHPGRRTPSRDRMHAALRKGGALRALLFVSGGGLLGLGFSQGVWFAAAGALSFMLALLRSLPLSEESGNSS